MNPRRLRAALVALVITVVLAGWIWASQPSANSAASVPPPAAPLAVLPLPVPVATAKRAAVPVVALSEDDHAFLQQLRTRFAPVMGSQHARIRLLEQLIAYLKAHYPEGWEAQLRAMLNELFPELAEALLAQFHKLQSYTAWLELQRSTLQGLSPQERRQALWAARLAAFGSEAEEIWAAERRSEHLVDALTAVDTRTGLTAQEKLGAYLSAIHESYGDQATRFLEQRQTEIMNRFISLDSVQEELQALPDAQRNGLLTDLRAQLGMEPDALQRWTSLDQKRDQSWADGQRYMQERARILAETPARQQEAQLHALRSRQFSDEEAAIIRDEEAAGFYRYGRPRRIGRE